MMCSWARGERVTSRRCELGDPSPRLASFASVLTDLSLPHSPASTPLAFVAPFSTASLPSPSSLSGLPPEITELSTAVEHSSKKSVKPS